MIKKQAGIPLCDLCHQPATTQIDHKPFCASCAAKEQEYIKMLGSFKPEKK